MRAYETNRRSHRRRFRSCTDAVRSAHHAETRGSVPRRHGEHTRGDQEGTRNALRCFLVEERDATSDTRSSRKRHDFGIQSATSSTRRRQLRPRTRRTTAVQGSTTDLRQNRAQRIRKKKRKRSQTSHHNIRTGATANKHSRRQIRSFQRFSLRFIIIFFNLFYLAP